MNTVLVTGANGFVGRALCDRMMRDGWSVRGAVRYPDDRLRLPKEVEAIVIGDIGPDTDWSLTLQGIDAVVHLAARVHVMHDAERDPLSVYRFVNTKGTERLARMAAQAGIRRFVFLSSIKVNGEETHSAAFTESVVVPPKDPYALSKWEAEEVLRHIAKETKLETVIVRSPLVYGPGVRANFFSLLRAVNRGLPLPFGAFKNQRSLIYVGNLVDALMTCLTHPRASAETFVVSDHDDVSTSELVRRIAYAFGKRSHLLSVPRSFFYSSVF